MSEPKWTPGPWNLRKAYLDDDLVEIVPRKVRGKASPEYGSWAELATVQIEYTDSAPKANAHLIAAAPEMYAAMAEFCRRVDVGEVRSRRTYAAFTAILAKARGEA